MEKRIYTNNESVQCNVIATHPQRTFTRGAKLAGMALMLALPALFSTRSADAYTITGTIFRAPNGLPMMDSAGIRGTATGNLNGQPIYVYVINQAGNIVHRTQVLSDGTYRIDSVVAGQAAAAQLASINYPLNSQLSFIGLPSKYFAVGEGNLPPGDLNPDYSFPLAQVADIEVDFAFEERPSSTNTVISSNTYSNNRLIVPATSFNGTDPEDGLYDLHLTGRTVDFYPAVPSSSTKIYYYDTLLDFSGASSNITITNFNPAQVSLRISGSAATRSFSYTVADNAGARPYVPTTISTAQPLYINLLSFGGEWKDEGAKINWTTATEKSNAYFIVERSTDGTSFQNITRVDSKAAMGNSSDMLSYSYFDASPEGNGHEDIYYRLRAVDMAGMSSVSKIIHLRAGQSATATAGGDWNVYPNPAAADLYVAPMGANNSNVKITLLDMKGSVLLSRDFTTAGAQAAHIDLSGIPNGSYFLQANSGNDNSFTRKITIAR